MSSFPDSKIWMVLGLDHQSVENGHIITRCRSAI